MKPGDYRITPVAVDGFADADGVYENQNGAWLGECDGETVMPFSDEDGDFVPAPHNWRDLVVQTAETTGLAPEKEETMTLITSALAHLFDDATVSDDGRVCRDGWELDWRGERQALPTGSSPLKVGNGAAIAGQGWTHEEVAAYAAIVGGFCVFEREA